jgi:hypothetical protein
MGDTRSQQDVGTCAHPISQATTPAAPQLQATQRCGDPRVRGEHVPVLDECPVQELLPGFGLVTAGRASHHHERAAGGSIGDQKVPQLRIRADRGIEMPGGGLLTDPWCHNPSRYPGARSNTLAVPLQML